MIPTYFKRGFSHTLIPFAFILFIANLTFADEITETIPYKNFIEQNKTWWYNSAIERNMGADYYYFGIKIDGDTIIEGIQWSKCWLIDVEKSKILSCPIALLREEDKKIHRYYKDFELEEVKKKYIEDCNNEYFLDLVEKYVVSLRQSFNLGIYNILQYDDFLFSPEEYPLYDFSSEIKQHFWPWSYLIPNEPNSFMTGKFNIPRAINDEDGRPFQAHRMERWYEVNNRIPSEESILNAEGSEFLIIEGVGIHKMESQFSSTFLLPAHIIGDLVGGWYPLPTLLMVTLNNDSDVLFRGRYGRNFSPDNAVYKDDVVENRSLTEIIYDLIGNEIKHPLSGRIYISNGKKIVWK